MAVQTFEPDPNLVEAAKVLVENGSDIYSEVMKAVQLDILSEFLPILVS